MTEMLVQTILVILPLDVFILLSFVMMMYLALLIHVIPKLDVYTLILIVMIMMDVPKKNVNQALEFVNIGTKTVTTMIFAL
jgi:hypothetical protein